MKRSRGKYPSEWKDGSIQRTVKAIAGNRCEGCGMEFHTDSNWAVKARTTNGKPVLASCHHLDHDRANNHLSNIVYLCAYCHLDCHRWSWRPGDELPIPWRTRLPNFIEARGLTYTKRQLELWSEK